MMELKEILDNYYGKDVHIVDIDGQEFDGLLSQYETSTDNDDEKDTIAIEMGGFFVEFPIDEISSIESA